MNGERGGAASAEELRRRLGVYSRATWEDIVRGYRAQWAQLSVPPAPTDEEFNELVEQRAKGSMVSWFRANGKSKNAVLLTQAHNTSSNLG
jgi:hypothetical protein